MSLTGEKVRHPLFGEGIIKSQDEEYLMVSFGEAEKKFVYPDAFRSFLSPADPEIAKSVSADLAKKQKTDEMMLRQRHEKLEEIRGKVKEEKSHSRAATRGTSKK